MDTILYLIAGPLLLISVAANLYVRFRLYPKDDPDLDEYYHEFEHQHPAYARYTKYSRITFAGIAAAILLMLLAAVI